MQQQMTDKETGATPTASGEEAQPGWRELTLKVAQLQAEVSAVANENKSLRLLLERVIGHWQKSHTDLVLIMANLVGKPAQRCGGDRLQAGRAQRQRQPVWRRPGQQRRGAAYPSRNCSRPWTKTSATLPPP